MDYNEIKDLLDNITKTDITHLNLEINNVKIELHRGVVVQPEFQPIPQVSVKHTNIDVVETNETIFENVSEHNGTKVVSPIVGTFYQSSSPTSEPFVKVGQRVKKGDVLFIIEAMKVINEVTSEVDGEILEILVEDNQFVEFNQHILSIG